MYINTGRILKTVTLGLFSLTLTACMSTTIPTLQLTHLSSVDKTYNNIGTVKVNTFLDQRPNNQTQLSAANWGGLGNPVNYSGETTPNMAVYLRNAITKEATRTNIFTPSSSGQYTMSGYITALSVSYKDEMMNLPVTLNGNSTPITLGGYPTFTAKVKYHVEIYRGTQQIFSKNIDETNTVKVQSGQLGVSDRDISAQAGAVLDQTVTKSVKDLFDSMSASGL